MYWTENKKSLVVSSTAFFHGNPRQDELFRQRFILSAVTTKELRQLTSMVSSQVMVRQE